jgi:phosphatidylglycerophosphatase A
MESIMKKIIHFLAYGFGSGLCPIMPGTCGTIVAIPIYLLLAQLPLLYYSIILVIMILVGFWLCDVTARDLDIHDPPNVVWDEIVGYLLTMIAVPINWVWVIVGFILFRVFDIWKPWPISWVNENVDGGFGIVIDDLLAAIPAAIILQIIIFTCG